MKKALGITLVLGGIFAVVLGAVMHQLNARHASQRARLEAAWLEEKAALEAALADARAHPQIRAVNTPAPALPPSSTRPTPEEIIAKLRLFNTAGGAGQGRALRQAVYWLEELAAAGPAALPAIRTYLAQNEEIDYPWPNQNRRDIGAVNDFILPPSLRFGLFEVVQRIGSAEAESILAEVLGSTGRGAELAWLARALQEMAPNKYREVALAAAHELLAHPLNGDSSSPLDRNDRNHLFSVLSLFGDTTYVASAQSQLVREDGQLDREALKYLQQSMGPQSVAVAARAYQDPRLTDPARKEPLVRLALAYVGADAQADAFYQAAVSDLSLTKSHRSNLIEDLNEDGFPDPKHLTLGDLPLIQNRIQLIEQVAPNHTDPVNVAAFKEAYKDLVNMRAKLVPPQP